MMRVVFLVFSLFCLLLAACSDGAKPASARIAVATNFLPVMEKLEVLFEASSGYDIEIISGSTGGLYAQIVNGAPYDVFLAADQAWPARLASEGISVGGAQFTYAIGQLVLWSPQTSPVTPQRLKSPNLHTFTTANPNLAPYGGAAQQTLEGLGFVDSLDANRVLGENIGQTFAFVQTGNAELGFVALSQVLSLPAQERGAYWAVPERFHAPIRQDAVMLKRGLETPAAIAFHKFLQSQEAKAVISVSGYQVL